VPQVPLVLVTGSDELPATMQQLTLAGVRLVITGARATRTASVLAGS
jgi:hypothetical protein